MLLCSVSWPLLRACAVEQSTGNDQQDSPDISRFHKGMGFSECRKPRRYIKAAYVPNLKIWLLSKICLHWKIRGPMKSFQTLLIWDIVHCFFLWHEPIKYKLSLMICLSHFSSTDFRCDLDHSHKGSGSTLSDSYFWPLGALPVLLYSIPLLWEYFIWVLLVSVFQQFGSGPTSTITLLQKYSQTS